jgi:hypothetical protein
LEKLVCTELGPSQCYCHQAGVIFRPCIACPNCGHRWHRSFLIFAHRSRVPTALRFSAPTCAALALAYNLCELNAEGFPFVFSFSSFPTAPLSTEHHRMDRLHHNDLCPSSLSLLDLRIGALRYPSSPPPVLSLRPRALQWVAHTW